MARRSEIRWRLWLGVAMGCVIFVSSAMAARKVRAFMVNDPQFVLSPEDRHALTLEGVRYASRARVMAVFSSDFGHSIFRMPLAERQRRLLAVDWVEEASVSRIWPNRVVVRVRERKPVAFVNLPWSASSRESRVALIDAQGVLLDPPLESRFAFPVLSGVYEQQTGRERRARVRTMLRVLEEIDPRAKEISEVNVESPENVKVVAQLGGRMLELMLGDGNYGRRYQNFVNHYPEIRKRSARVTAFDLRLDDRITAKQ
jgi:cell division protein FtsQ